jgi:superfamily II DNA or RNA helicase
LAANGIKEDATPLVIPAKMASDLSAVSNLSSPDAKLALFRGLFRGREDVYAVRWEKGGKAGYSPAGIMDWHAIRDAKPEDRKKVARKTRSLLPLTDEVVRQHLEGKATIGVFPLLLEETCWFLAVDFDKASWQKDATAFRETCQRFFVPVAIERSRSGNGAHAWMFFDRPVLASDARRLGCALLTRTTEMRHEVGLSSYDRLFPNQDTMPKGGFGNLIALPLQRGPRKVGNSVFVDDVFQAYADQWHFLWSVKRIPIDTLASLIRDVAPEGDVIGVKIGSGEGESRDDPWLLPPSRRRKEKPITGTLPSKTRAVLSNLVYVERVGLPAPMLDRLIRLAAFQNPEFYKSQAMRLSTYGKPRVISCAESFPDHIGLPRGCFEEVVELFKTHGIELDVHDERIMGVPLDVRFQGTLLPSQKDAVGRMAGLDMGIICAPTAFGKTAVAAWLIAQRKVNTLVIVHRQQLLDQWRARLSTFLNLTEDSIGQIGAGKTKRSGNLDVAVFQSLQRKGEVRDLVADYGQVVVDECHHVSAFTFEQVLKQVKARYILGLTATPFRKDGHHPIITMQCGPIRFNLSARKAAETSPFVHRVITRQTNFLPPPVATELSIQELYAAMMPQPERNRLIVRDVEDEVRLGRSPLVLSGRTDHVEHLASMVSSSVAKVFVLRGGMGKKQRREIAEAVSAVPDSEPRIIVATGSYIGEGFDDPRLDTLFLAMPISWKGTLQQYVGRLHRLHTGKKEVRVYDYVDCMVPMLARMFKKRLAGYEAIGYSVTDPKENELAATKEAS